MANKEQPDKWTILTILTWTESYFKSRTIDSPRLTAEMLLAHNLAIKRLDLYLQYDRPLEKQELESFKSLIKRRVQSEPVAYITGQKGFFESDFEVTPDVLIPRPDTECIVEEAIKALDDNVFSGEPKNVIELGTGSGAIAVSLAKARPGHRYAASDISLGALLVAQKNANKISETKIDFCVGNWFSCFAKQAQFSLIVSNPPYIPSGDIGTLQPEIQLFEPMLALDGGQDGLDCYRIILNDAHNYLVPGGTLLLEIGYDQRFGIREIVQGLSNSFNYQAPEFVKDLAGHNRVAIVKKSID
ncbi:MAG: peptide chain release factor N(5)-glutamine methyltransferase [Desulfobacula sp.]|nr:peptide chain release factor N(5)-glutamine methyltransferase [Desulfobacula sp.]